MASEKTWFVLEVNTGAVEGCWGLEEKAHQSAKHMEERYEKSAWVVCSLDPEQMHKASQYGGFPNERIAHESRFARKGFVERVLEDA
jgi:hypothetical protein